jgi:large subunit ribosomal protein L28
MQPRCQLLSGHLPTSRTIVSSHRAYATAVSTPTPAPAVKNPLQRRKGGDLGSHLPKHVIPKDAYIPAYPYGDHALFKQANRGLYGDAMIQFGNNVSEKSETKTRRIWKPNVLSKSLYSVALKKKIKLKITSKVLKTVDREGGLDEYLLKDTAHRLKEIGPLGWALRWTLLQRPEVIDRMRVQAARLGLDQALIDAQWPTQQMLARQKVTQHGLVRASDMIPDEYEGTAEDDAAELAAPEHETAVSKAYTPTEKRVAREAKLEYVQAVRAAIRYFKRDLVDSEEQGLKFAFIRANLREEASKRNKDNHAKKIDQQFSAADLKATREKFNLPAVVTDDAVKRIAYNQWRRQQIEQTGSYEAWRDGIDAAKALEHAAEVEAAGGEAVWQGAKKGRYADEITQAENALTDQTLDPAKRKFLVEAMKKAERAIRARSTQGEKADKGTGTKITGGNAYAEATVTELRARKASGVLKGLEDAGGEQGEEKEKAEGDAWAALVNANNRPAETRLNA